MMSRLRWKMAATLLTGMALLVFVSCSAQITINEGGGLEVSFTIANETFTFTLGSAGEFELQGGASQQKAAAIPLFTDDTEDNPVSAAIELDISKVQAIPLGDPKTQAIAQAVSGTVEVIVRIGDGESTNPCDTGVDIGTYTITFAGGEASVDDASLSVPLEVLPFLISGRFTICLEASATIDITFIIEELDCVFGPAPDDDSNGNDNGPGNDNANDNGDDNANVNGDDNGNDNTAGNENDNGSNNGNGNANDNGSMEMTVQVPIDENGDGATPNTTIDEVDYWTGTADENAGIMEVATADATAARWPNMIGIDLGALGLATVETMYFGTFSGYAPDLPGGVTVATLTCEYAEGGDPTTLEFTTGLNTAEWSYDREEHTTLLGGVAHPIIPELYTYMTSIGSASTYTGYSYAGSLELDPERTLTCIKLALAPDSPFAGLRDPENATPTWLAQTMSAITLEGPEGEPASDPAMCTPDESDDGGFTEAAITRVGAEHLIAGPDVDPTLSLQTPAGYAPGRFGTKAQALSGDGTKVWVSFYDEFPNVEGDPQTQLWSVNTDGTGGMRSSLPDEDIRSGVHVVTNIDGSIVVADNPWTTTMYRASPGTGVTALYDYEGVGDARGVMRLSDDASTLLAVNFSQTNVTVADLSAGTPTPQVLTTTDAMITNGVDGNVTVFELDMTSDASQWMVGSRNFDSDLNRNRWPIFIGTGLSGPSLSLVTTERDDLGFSEFQMTDDGQTIGYCRQTILGSEVGRCFLQATGSAARTEISDAVENVGNLSIADDGSKAFMSTRVGAGGGEGFIYDIATGERYVGGSQWFSDEASPDFVSVEWSDDGRLLMAAVSSGIYILHDDNVPAGFPTIERILYRMNDEDCSMTVRVEVDAPLGIERIFTLPFYRGLEASRGEIDNDNNPLFSDRSGGGVNVGTIFEQIESGVWERNVRLTNGSGECASALLNADFSLRIILVEETTTRTVYADFVPVP